MNVGRKQSRPLNKNEMRSLQTRQKLLESAIWIIQNQGIGALNVRSICAKAGVTTGAFYHSFDSKEDVINYYIVYVFREYEAQADARGEGLPPLERIRYLYLYMAKCYVAAGHEFMAEFYSPTNKLLNFKGRDFEGGLLLDRACEYLREAQEQGIVRAGVDLEDAKLRIAEIVTGVFFYWCVFEGEIDVERRVDERLREYLQSLTA